MAEKSRLTATDTGDQNISGGGHLEEWFGQAGTTGVVVDGCQDMRLNSEGDALPFYP